MPDRKWKASCFNLHLDEGETHVVFNSVSGQMLALTGGRVRCFDDSLAEIDRRGECSDRRMMRCLTTLGFAVPVERDEYHEEQRRFASIRANEEKMRIIIAPTMACNQRCIYCFQQEMERHNVMAEEIQGGVVEFVRRIAPGRRQLVVQWFGGEPLLAYERIVAMSGEFRRISAENGIEYYSEMLTNGTLLTSRIIEEFPLLVLKSIQISLDGDPSTYASRRRYPLAKSRVFHRFLAEHLQAIVDATGSVTIRINIDRSNFEASKEVVRMIKACGCLDPRLDFRLGFLNTSRGIVENIPHDCLSPLEFSHLEVEFMSFLEAEGYRVYGRPERRDHSCAAPLRYTFTIDPEGRIGKCVPAIGTEQSVFSRIYPGDPERTVQEVRTRAAPYTSFDPFASDACRECKLLPACLGSCPKMHRPGDVFLCAMKPNLPERLRFFCGYPA